MALQNSGHEIPIIDLLKKYGANFNLENTKALRYPFEEPLTMGQEALLQASTEGRTDIVKHLLSMGVSAHFFVEHAKEFHCSTNPMVRDSSIKTMQGAGVSIHACGQ